MSLSLLSFLKTMYVFLPCTREGIHSNTSLLPFNEKFCALSGTPLYLPRYTILEPGYFRFRTLSAFKTTASFRSDVGASETFNLPRYVLILDFTMILIDFTRSGGFKGPTLDIFISGVFRVVSITGIPEWSRNVKTAGWQFTGEKIAVSR